MQSQQQSPKSNTGSSSSHAEHMTTPSGTPTPLWNYLYNSRNRKHGYVNPEAQAFAMPWDKLLSVNKHHVSRISATTKGPVYADHHSFPGDGFYKADDPLEEFERERSRALESWTGASDPNYRKDVPLPPPSRTGAHISKDAAQPVQPRAVNGSAKANLDSARQCSGYGPAPVPPAARSKLQPTFYKNLAPRFTSAPGAYSTFGRLNEPSVNIVSAHTHDKCCSGDKTHAFCNPDHQELHPRWTGTNDPRYLNDVPLPPI